MGSHACRPGDGNLAVSRHTNELLRDEGKSIGFYDTRIAGPAQQGAYDATKDPSLITRGTGYPTLGERLLLNRRLGMVSSDYYAGPFGGGWPIHPGTDDWMAIKWTLGLDQAAIGLGLDVILPTFRHISERGVSSFFGEGYYDRVCSPFDVEDVASQVSYAAKDRVIYKHYEFGHIVPADEFDADAGRFIAKVLRGPAVKVPALILD